jgi:hypothetical protein
VLAFKILWIIQDNLPISRPLSPSHLPSLWHIRQSVVMRLWNRDVKALQMAKVLETKATGLGAAAPHTLAFLSVLRAEKG